VGGGWVGGKKKVLIDIYLICYSIFYIMAWKNFTSFGTSYRRGKNFTGCEALKKKLILVGQPE